MKKKWNMLLKQLFIPVLFCLIQQSISYGQNPGDTDPSFKGGHFDGTVRVIKVQADGKILVGGDFTHYKTTAIKSIARLNSDGTLDNTFKAGSGANNRVCAIAIQTDGKILAGGDFTHYKGNPTGKIIRLNSDGTIDNSFSLSSTVAGTILNLSIQSDNKIIATGGITVSGSNELIIRINDSDGSIDNTFNAGFGANSHINTASIQSDGKIIIGGEFSYFNSTTTNTITNVGRLNTDGSFDFTFNPGTGANNFVYGSSIQSDGKIILGGAFTYFANTGKSRIVRLNTDGTIDNAFNTGNGADNVVTTIIIMSNDKILVGGNFIYFNFAHVNCITRLNSDGSLDNTFNAGSGASDYILTSCLQPDGKILLGGFFSSFGNKSYKHITRLLGDAVTTGTISEITSTETYIKIYPNPSSEFIIIESNTYGVNTELYIFSVNGVLLKNFTLNNSDINKVDIDKLKEGIYIYELRRDGNILNQGTLKIN